VTAIETVIHALVRDLAMAADLATDLPPLAARLAGRFWPGPISEAARRAASEE